MKIMPRLVVAALVAVVGLGTAGYAQQDENTYNQKYLDKDNQRTAAINALPALESQRNSLTSEITTLEGQINYWQGQADYFDGQLQSNATALSSAQSTLSNAQSDLSSKQSQLSSIQSNISSMQSWVSGLYSNIAYNMGQIALLDAIYPYSDPYTQTQIEIEIFGYELQILFWIDDIAAVSADISTAQSDYNSMASQVSAAQTAVNNAQAAVNSLLNARDTLQAEKNFAAGEVTTKTNAKNQKVSQRDTVNDTITNKEDIIIAQTNWLNTNSSYQAWVNNGYQP